MVDISCAIIIDDVACHALRVHIACVQILLSDELDLLRIIVDDRSIRVQIAYVISSHADGELFTSRDDILIALQRDLSRYASGLRRSAINSECSVCIVIDIRDTIKVDITILILNLTYPIWILVRSMCGRLFLIHLLESSKCCISCTYAGDVSNSKRSPYAARRILTCNGIWHDLACGEERTY